jgi:DNA-binding CsgD family transcriptional regulator
MKRTGKNKISDISDTECLEVLSTVASRLGIEEWSDTVHGKEAEAITLARKLHKGINRLIGIDDAMVGDDEPVTLTEMEMQVLQWASNGKSIGDTAILMSVTERSVRTARASIGRKLKSNSVTLSITKAHKLGLL